jgi:Zn-dependent M28 family amino/carboxypeptidase
VDPGVDAHLAPPAPLDEVLAGDDSPLALARLLTGRDNAAREAALARYLEYRGIPFTRHRFVRAEGRGESYVVEVGAGERVLVLCAHHDAVAGSPGANDNAAAVGILLHLVPRLEGLVPRGWRVRLLFTAAEELDYLGARAYVEEAPLAGIAGVLSLELCGIGDAVAIWDVAEESAFLRQVTGALDALGLERDRGYHTIGRIPVFGSDHRAFAAAGVPAYGFSLVPLAHAEALRQFVLSPMRSAFRALVRRPPPFDTYHTSRDGLATLEPAALDRAASALAAIVRGLARS